MALEVEEARIASQAAKEEKKLWSQINQLEKKLGSEGPGSVDFTVIAPLTSLLK